MRKAAFWLCEGQGEAGTVGLLRRALKGKLGFGDVAENTEEEKKWVRSSLCTLCAILKLNLHIFLGQFIAVRKTLEAKMSFAHLFPPGRLWWAVRDESLHPSHQSAGGGLRLFEVHHVEQVFRQIEFKGDMLRFVSISWLVSKKSYTYLNLPFFDIARIYRISMITH